MSDRPPRCRDCRRTASHRDDCKVGRYQAAVDALTPAEKAVYDELPYMEFPDPDDAVRVLAAARPLIERELREQIAAETRAMGFAASMTGRTLAKRGQPHLSAECAWNEARDTIAAQIARGGASDGQ